MADQPIGQGDGQAGAAGRAAETGAALPEMPFSIDMMMGLNGLGLETAKEVRETLMHGMTSWSEGFGQFMSARMDQDFELMRELMGCRSPRDVMDREVAFLQKAMMQYAEEGSRMLGLMAQMQDQYWAHVETAKRNKPSKPS
ncbi:MAG: phasin family protein [Alphaproteobacteria bacterium]